MSTPKRVFKLAIVRANGCGMLRATACTSEALPTYALLLAAACDRCFKISRSSFFFFFFLKLCRVISAPDTHMVSHG